MVVLEIGDWMCFGEKVFVKTASFRIYSVCVFPNFSKMHAQNMVTLSSYHQGILDCCLSSPLVLFLFRFVYLNWDIQFSQLYCNPTTYPEMC